MFRERAPGLDPDAFWAEPLPAGRASDMRAKYEGLAELARARGDARGELIRCLAARWRGSVREGELIGPDRVAQRLASAEQCQTERTGSQWREQGDAATAVVLWSHLHPLVADVLRFRTQRRGPSQTSSFAAWVENDADARERWPQSTRLEELLGPRVSVRTAYLWLAARSGASLVGLNGLLFARGGHWDRRTSDPGWAHEPEPG